jgi:hypothetical protein
MVAATADISNQQSSTTQTPWYDYPDLSNYGEVEGKSYEHGTDLETPPDTPMTAILPGTVTDVGYYPWGGQITWKLDNPSEAHNFGYEYIIHLDAINPAIRVGTHLNQGDFLGFSGGENSGAQLQAGKPLPPGYSHHLTSSQYSTGWHEEIGLYGGPQFGYGSAWNSPPDPSENPDFLLSYAQMMNLPSGDALSPQPGDTSGNGNGTSDLTSASSGDTQNSDPLPVQVHNLLVQNPGFSGIVQAIDKAEQFPGVYNGFSNTSWSLDVGSDIGNAIQDTVSTVWWTLADNLLPLVVRTMIIAVGVLLVVALCWRAVSQVSDASQPLLGNLALAAAL